MRGVEIEFTREAIYTLFSDEKIRKGSAYADKIAKKGNQLQWVANIIVVHPPVWAAIGSEISHHDLSLKTNLGLNLCLLR